MSKFLTPLNDVFASATRVRVLRELMSLGAGVSGRETALLAGVSLGSAQAALEDLVALGLVVRDTTRSQHLYPMNRRSTLVRDGLEPLFASERARVSAVFDRVRGILSGGEAGKEPGVESAALIGSAARGEDGPRSDLDLLVVVKSPEHADRVHRLLSDAAPGFAAEFGLALSPVVMDVERLRTMYAAGDPFAEAVLRESRTILGPSIGEWLRGHGRTAEDGGPVAGREVPAGGKRAPGKRPRARRAGDG